MAQDHEQEFERALAELSTKYMFHDNEEVFIDEEEELERAIAPLSINYMLVHDLEELERNFERALAELSMNYVPVDDHDEEELSINYVPVEDHEEEEELERALPEVSGAVEVLEKITIRGSQRETTCTVCLKEFPFGSEATRMPCSHVFHGECIVRWLHVQRFCPLCRFQFAIS